MRIRLDQGVPAPLRHGITGHIISTAYEMGWAQLDNGDLLNAAEASFDALITTDQNLRYQQNQVLADCFTSCARMVLSIPKISFSL